MDKPYLGGLGRLVGALARSQQRKLSYASCRALGPEAWARSARESLREHLDFSPEPVALDPETIAIQQQDGYSRETVSFASTAHHRMTAEILIPDGAVSPCAAILALHDHGGFYTHGREKVVEGLSDSEALVDFVNSAYQGRYWASELARRGYVVMVADVLGWGQRRLAVADLQDSVQAELDGLEEGSHAWVRIFNAAFAEAAPALDKHANFAGTSWLGVVNWDDRRCVEYLGARAEVDSSRIACAGLSGGGWRASYLVGAEDRLAAAVVAGWMARLGDQLTHDNRSHIGLYSAPSVYRYLDLPDIAASSCPRPLLVMNCQQDRLFSMDSMRGACDDIGKVYRDAGCPEHFEARVYDVPHCLNVEMQEEMFAWLRANL